MAAVWGASFLFMHIAGPEFGPLATSALRVGIAALVLLPLVLARGQGAAMLRYWRPIAAIGLFNAGIPFACFTFALMHISTGLTSILNATMPLFTALVAWIWFGHRPGPARLLGLAIGFAGVALLVISKSSVGRPGVTAASGGQQVLAMAACLCATLCYGIAACASRKYLATVPSIAVAAGSNLSAAVLLLVPAMWWGPRSMPSVSAWMAIAAVGVFCTALAYALYYRMIQTTGPAITSTVTYVVPLFALFYGYLFLHETITPAMLGYGALILLGTALSALAPALRMFKLG
jgi:drug/metabolite transporter (DMT)-like permease